MDDQTSKDEAAKKRIVSHMNKDHHDSIVCYLEHYGQLSAWTAYGGVMMDINLNEMALVCDDKKYRIPFEPPMQSLREARERVVEMDKECREALGKSDITVKEFAPPTGIYALEFAIVAATFLSYSRRYWFERGQVVEWILGSSFARFSWTIQPWLIAFMVCLHTFEVIYFIRNHLREHCVYVRSLLWWKWVATTFVEGQFAFKRWRDLVRRKTDEKEKQKH